nr:hypothetical protein [Fusobacterium gastrosuis]
MEKEKKNLLLTFIDLATEQGLLEDGIKAHKKKLFNLMAELEKRYTGDKKIFVQLERAIIDILDLTQYKYFDYGKIANDIDENYTLEYDPFKRLAE